MVSSSQLSSCGCAALAAHDDAEVLCAIKEKKGKKTQYCGEKICQIYAKTAFRHPGWEKKHKKRTQIKQHVTDVISIVVVLGLQARNDGDTDDEFTIL